ncbi:HD-GYP domain-containing protein [Paenibacillus lemnae]|uniref:HD-GYP domain-containing protein n=1 Tax=Paenibacillus lemnae TaxID=1330551 RepID=A0A848M245_PAELE|nr:HD-GYP domain-containing protein [Paenibacillus lemnae]NMO95048.1 HD-GYP domain-containing protein [Paenibacillus lemnae]
MSIESQGSNHSLSAHIGYRLKQNVYSKDILLLPACSILTARNIELLLANHVHICDEDIEPTQAVHMVDQAVEELKAAFVLARCTLQVPIARIRSSITPLIVDLNDSPDIRTLFYRMEQSDEYTYRHSIGVALLSRLIGKELGLKHAQLNELTEAALLHDIGKVMIPEEIINKPGRLTDMEMREMQQHTIYGYEMLKRTPEISSAQAMAALQHHEREDGKGYPFKLRSEEIDFYSKIVAAADVFHAMVSKRPYKNPAPVYRVLKEMTEHAYGMLDPRVTLKFVKRIMDMMIGNQVLLSNGCSGKVIMIHPQHPIRPLIQVNGHYIDLDKERAIEMIDWA